MQNKGELEKERGRGGEREGEKEVSPSMLAQCDGDAAIVTFSSKGKNVRVLYASE